MSKKLLLLLLLIPTLCFAKLGETQKAIEETRYGRAIMEDRLSNQIKMAKYIDSDGETLVVIMYHNSKSVIETYFNRLNRPLSFDYIEKVIGDYGTQWIPFEVSEKSCRCVKSYENEYYRICYGPITRTSVAYGLTVLSLDAEAALKDLSQSTPYTRGSGLRL